MKIRQVTLREIRIPLKFRFSQSNNAASTKSHSALVELHTEDGLVGYGEACPRTYVTGESMASMQNDIQKLEPILKTTAPETVEKLPLFLEQLAAQSIGNSTRCALETAFLDVFSKSTGAPLMELLKINTPSALQYSLVLPLVTPAKLEQLLERLQKFQPRAIKLKVDSNLREALANIRLIQSHFGTDTSVRIDVNGGWNLEDALCFIPKFIAAGITSFEQPLPANQLEGLQALTRKFGHTASIMVDETLLSLQSAKHLLEGKIGNHFNLKISKLGGIFAAQNVYHLAQQHGVPCQLGAHFGETSILTKAGIVLTSMIGELTALEGALGTHLLQKDVLTPSVRQRIDGQLRPAEWLTNTAGWGPVDEQTLEEYGVKFQSLITS